MDTRIVILTSRNVLEPSELDAATEFLRKCKEKESSVGDSGDSQRLFAVVDSSCIQDAIRWERCDDLARLQPIKPPSGDDGDLEALADRLHALADTLPKFGVDLHVLWFGGDNWPDIEQNLELYGALKRLSVWHNAHIVLLHSCQNEAETSAGVSWAQVLMAPFLEVQQLEDDHSFPLWHGSMKIYGAEMNQPVTFPGFTLRRLKSMFPTYQWVVNDRDQDMTSKFSDVLVDSAMQFLTSVYIRDIPALYITSQTYEIEVAGSGPKCLKSKKFLSPLIENPQLGYLVRLPHGTSWAERVLTPSQKGAENQPKLWSDCLVENIINVQEPIHNIELSGETGFYHFLLCGGQGHSGRHVIKAHLMRTPSEINGDIARVLADFETKYACDDKTLNEEEIANIEACIDGLPHYKAETFLRLETSIQEAQISTLQVWIESCKKENKDCVITGGDLLYLLSATRRQYMAKYREKYGDARVEYPEPSRKRLVLNTAPEHGNPDTSLERKVLAYHQQLQEKLKRSKSNDSLGGLSPPVQGHVLKLHASELLKFFNSDGTPKDPDLEPIQVKKSRLRKYDSGELRTADWPQCSHYKFHDVYYNVGQTPEKTAQKSTRIADRMKGHETLSTCTQAQSDHPASIKITRKRKSSGSTAHTTPKTRRMSSLRRTPTSNDRGRKRSHSNITPTHIKDSGNRASKRHRPSDVTSPPHDVTRRPPRDATRQPPPDATRQAPLRERSANRHEAQAVRKQRSEKVAKYVEKAETGSKEKESRSARHKKKLEETVKQTLLEHGVGEGDGVLYSRCYDKLYKLTYTQVKALRSYTSLRAEMQTIAGEHVEMVVMFERSKLAQASQA